MLTDKVNRRGTDTDHARPSLNRSPDQHGLAARISWAVRALVVSLCLVSLPLNAGMAAPLAQDASLIITYPTAGSTLSGQVPIQGTATHPNFASYGVLYATGTEVTGTTLWQHDKPIAWDVRSMTVNGVLGTWDTTLVPNGSYVLAIAMYVAGEETPSVYFVSNLTVNNEAATPTPEPSATPAEETEGEPTTEAAPPPAAATIVLPATATPRPTATLAPDEADEGNDGEDDGGLLSSDLFSLDAVKEAFRLGAQIAFMIYAIGMLYVLAKAVIRYYLRQTRRKSNP